MRPYGVDTTEFASIIGATTMMDLAQHKQLRDMLHKRIVEEENRLAMIRMKEKEVNADG